MAILSATQIASYAKRAGFSGQGLTSIIAIALAESGGNTLATNTVGNSAGTDRGLYQINSAYHPEVSNAAAFDPAQASIAVYRISGAGTNFNPWATYTSGRYRSYLAAAQNGANSVAGTSSVVSTGTTGGGGVPAQRSWYTFPRIDNLGTPDPYGGFPKPDSNIMAPANYPLTALLPGTVTALDGGSVAWGAVVTIKLDQPVNALATHTAYLHLADYTVRVGQHVNAGDLIGHVGATAAAGAQKTGGVGFALYNGDHYGFGAAWLLMTKANLTGQLNPVPLLNQAATGQLVVPAGNAAPGGAATGGLLSGIGIGLVPSGAIPIPTFTSLLDQVHMTLTTNPGFYGIALAVDEAEQFPGYLDLTTSQQDISIAGIDSGVKLPDVNGIIRSIGATISDNALPFVIRSGLVIVGLVLLIALFIKPIGGVVQMVAPFVE